MTRYHVISIGVDGGPFIAATEKWCRPKLSPARRLVLDWIGITALPATTPNMMRCAP
jgi:hypothetical protein